MARMIDADRLLRELTALSHGQVWPGWTYDGIRLLIERQPTLTPPNEWVSVEERLPEPGERVLATDCVYRCGCPEPNGCKWFDHMATKHLNLTSTDIQQRYDTYNEVFYE